MDTQRKPNKADTHGGRSEGLDKQQESKNYREKKYQKIKDAKEERKQQRINMQVKEIKELQSRLDIETPPCGVYPKSSDENNETVPLNLRPKAYFKDLALSSKTIRGLNEDKKYKLTPIQRASIPHSLYNRDIMGASKTGSGKTIAFVIPVLEKLFLKRWSTLDGLGALIILPTRELAIQVFEVFKTIGKYHDFSLGLIIGGNNLQKEQAILYNMNILVGTPGRILQHISETPYFTADNLQMLVIDEADRILDEGFEADLTEILSYLPTEKQTLLFSATLTKSLKTLAKVNMKCPEHISINNIENMMALNDSEPVMNDKISKVNLNIKGESQPVSETNSAMPKNLHQFYSVVEADRKLDVLYSFLNTHKNTKIIAFLSTCKQVRFFYEAFSKMKLGFSFLELHGGQKQSKRTAIFYNFLEKTNTVLFATDIAARGMDFPSINWVIQVDAPEDVETYIHRVGRTARYKSQGSSLLFLSESEKDYLKQFDIKSIPIKSISINNDKIVNLQPILRSILSESKDIQYLAQKALSCYVKSVALQKNKKVFDYKKIDINKLSLSYGLMVKPEFITKGKMKEEENKDTSDKDLEPSEPKKNKLEKFKDKIKLKKALKQQVPEETSILKVEKADDDGFLRKKRVLTVQEIVDHKPDSSKREDSIKVDIKQSDSRYKEISQKLKTKEYDSKQENKDRVKALHKQQRLANKQKDYEKHGLNDNDDEDEGLELGENDDEESETVVKPSDKAKKSLNNELMAKQLLSKPSKKLLI